MKQILLLSLALCLPATAALTISEQASLPSGIVQNSEGASGFSKVENGNSKGQGVSFIRGAHLTGFVFKIAGITTASDLTVSIYATSGGVPTGSALFTDTGTLPAGLAGGDFVQVDFPSTLDLAAGDYAILLDTTGSDFNLRLNKDNDYAGGVLLKDQGSGWVVANAGFDTVFSVLGTMDPPNTLTITEIPAFPATAALENKGGTAGSTLVDAATSKGQTFSFATDAHLTGVVWQVNSVTTLSDIQLKIYQTTGGQPSGAPVFEDGGTLPGTLVAGDYVQMDFPSTVDLPAGDYAFVLKTTGSNLTFRLNNSNGYAGGRLIRDTGSGWANGANTDSDFRFSLQGTIDPPVSRPAASSGPNIVFVLVDDYGWTDHNIAALAQGNESDFYQTPNLARLASEGVSFTSAYAQPNCAPTRAALLTGQYSCRTGNGVYNVTSLNRSGSKTTYTTAADQGDEHANGDEDTITIAEALYDAGYVTAHFGKYHAGSSDPGSDTHPLNQGFDYNYGGGNPGNPGNFFASGGMFANNVGPELDAFAADYTSTYITDNLTPYATGNNPSTLNGTSKHLTDAMGDAFISFMNSHRAGSLSAYPVYAQLHFYAVHTPIQGRPDLVSKYAGLTDGVNHDNNAYAALIENMDHTLGRVLDYLDDPNGDGNTSDSIAEDTVIIFTSDNGGHMGPTSNLPLRGRKGMHYEGGIRVPLVIRRPGVGNIPAGKVSDTLVHCIDYYPTMLDFAGATYPSSTTHPLDGESLHAHLLDPDNVARNRSPVFYHFPGYMDSRTYACSMMIKDVGAKRYKYIYAYDPYYDPGNDSSTGNATKGFDQYQLYNLTDDIGETINLMDYIDEENASDPNDPSDSREYWDYILYKDLANQMASELNAWLEGTQGDSTWNPIYNTYKSNYPGIDPGQIGQPTGPAPASVPDVQTPVAQSFRVISSSSDASNNITLTFPSEPGFTYRIQGSSSLQSGDWDDLGTSVTPNSGTQTTHTVPDPDAAAENRRFYRVVLMN